jgi:nucleoside-diphosphate-sugar epimerase
MGGNIANPILVTGAAGRVGAIGRTVTELLMKHGKAVRAMVRTEDERAQGRCAIWVRRSWSGISSISIRCTGRQTGN